MLCGMAITELTSRRAVPADLDALTDLVIRSKASNGYSGAFMQVFRPELVISPGSLDTGEVWVMESGPDLAGVMHLVVADEVAEVEVMFVEPAFKRKGVGRRMWLLAEERTRALGGRSIELDADPFAVAFYEAMGCSLIGQTPSGTIPGRMLPRMAKRLTRLLV